MRRIRHILLVVVGLALSWNPAPAAEADPWLPADASMVLTVNVRATLDAAVVQKHAMDLIKGALRHNEQVEKFFAAAGLDPLRDVQSVVVGASGAGMKNVVVLVHGNFDLEKIRKAATDFAAKNPTDLVIHQEGALTIYESKQGTHTTFAAFADKGTLVAAPTQALLASTVARKSAGPSRELQAVLGAVDGRQSVWLAAVPSAEAKKMLGRNPQVQELADKIQWFGGGVTLDRGVQAAFQVQTADTAAAEKLARLLDGLKGFATLLVSGNPQFGKLLTDGIESIEIGTDRTAVKLGLKLSEEQIDRALKPAPKKP
jgi:hypothetical protein